MYDWQYFFHHIPNHLDLGNYHIFEPQWKPELLQWFEREDVDSEQKEAFIQALIDFDDGCGDFYRYRAYFLASEAIAHFPSSSQADEIVGQLLKWSYSYFQEKPDWHKYPEPLAKAAREYLKVTDKKRVIAAFTKLIHTTESRQILRHAAERLGKLDPGNKSAIAALVLLIQVTTNQAQLGKIVDSLIEIDPDNPIAHNILVNLTWTSNGHRAIIDRIRKIEETCPDKETVISTLVELIQFHQNDYILQVAAKKLGQIDPGNKIAIDTLVKMIRDSEDLYGLSVVETSNPTGVAILIKLLAVNSDESIPRAVARRLGEIGAGYPEAITTLIELIQTSEDTMTLELAAASLGEIGSSHPATMGTLLRLMETHTDENIYCAATAAVMKINPSDENAIAILSQILQTTQNERILWQAADSLLETDSVRELAINSLIEMVKIENYRYTSSHIFDQALKSLKKLDPSLKIAISSLEKWLDTNPYVAADKLLEIDPLNQKAIAALEQLISGNEEEFLVKDAAERLGKIQPANELAISTIINLIKTTEEAYHRGSLINILEEIGADNERIVATLIHSIRNFPYKDDDYYEYHIVNLADILINHLESQQLPQLVRDFKNYLEKGIYQDWAYHYEVSYKLVWHCAQNMTYPDFYQAWHN